MSRIQGQLLVVIALFISTNNVTAETQFLKGTNNDGGMVITNQDVTVQITEDTWSATTSTPGAKTYILMDQLCLGGICHSDFKELAASASPCPTAPPGNGSPTPNPFVVPSPAASAPPKPSPSPEACPVVPTSCVTSNVNGMVHCYATVQNPSSGTLKFKSLDKSIRPMITGDFVVEPYGTMQIDCVTPLNVYADCAYDWAGVGIPQGCPTRGSIKYYNQDGNGGNNGPGG